jgi:ubiquinone/menaquinone biosynthesis C-methylase UbiE
MAVTNIDKTLPNSSTTGYNYPVERYLTDAKNVRDAIEVTVLNYFHDQLGLSKEFCRERVSYEEQRTIPKSALKELVESGWDVRGKRVLDLGAGQGGMVLELLEREADAYGVEPGSEFATLARMRLEEQGYDPARVRVEGGESLTFKDNYFDYVMSLQVLEHVPNPEAVLRELFRVLQPGGRCHVSCENYLSFREPHYRVRWFPLLPKGLGTFYLRILGRDPNFLNKYIHYTTYPQIWRICSRIGFKNLTYEPLVEKLNTPASVRTCYLRVMAYLLRLLPKRLSRRLVYGVEHLRNVLKPIVSVTLQKPFYM